MPVTYARAVVESARFELDGRRVTGIASFYDELNRALMPNEEWTLGASLDALDDLLYGGIGELAEVTSPIIVMRHHERVREALGVAATRAYYLQKLSHPEVFHVERFRRQLAELDAGRGPTYFDTVCEVFAGHPNVRLVLD